MIHLINPGRKYSPGVSSLGEEQVRVGEAEPLGKGGWGTGAQQVLVRGYLLPQAARTLFEFQLVFGSIMPHSDITVVIFLSSPLGYKIFKGKELPFHISHFPSECRPCV